MRSVQIRLLFVAVIIGLSACASSHQSVTTDSSSSSVNSSTSIGLTALATKIRNGVAGISTAHLRYLIDNAGRAAVITGEGKFTAGAATAIALTDAISPTESVRVVLIAKSIYVQLPTSLNHFGKPWVLVTPQSTDPVLQGLNSLASAQEATSFLYIFDAVHAAQSLRNDGVDNLNGSAVTKYSVIVEIAKLPTNPDNQPLIDAGLKTLPADIWVDAHGRPLQFRENYTVQGQRINLQVTYSRFNTPVTITAPPRDQTAVS